MSDTRNAMHTPTQRPEALAALASRRSSPPTCLAQPVPDERQLDTILTLAARTPDHGKLVPYRFVVLDQAACRRMGDHVQAAFESDNPGAEPESVAHSRQRFDRAPMIVAVVSKANPNHPKIPEWEQVLTAGAVCMNLLHAANASGFGAIWLTGWTTYDRRVLDALGLESTERLAGWIHVGTQTEPRAERARPDLSEIVTRPEKPGEAPVVTVVPESTSPAPSPRA